MSASRNTNRLPLFKSEDKLKNEEEWVEKEAVGANVSFAEFTV